MVSYTVIREVLTIKEVSLDEQLEMQQRLQNRTTPESQMSRYKPTLDPCQFGRQTAVAI